MNNNKVTKLGRLPDNALDDYYIQAFLNKPGNKTKAYLVAYDRYCAEAVEQGIEPYQINRDYAYTYVRKLHDRLRERITAELYKLAEDDKRLGRSVLRQLAENAESESVKAQCASNLAKGLYPDVQVTKQETIEDIDKELKQIEQETKEAERVH